MHTAQKIVNKCWVKSKQNCLLKSILVECYAHEISISIVNKWKIFQRILMTSLHFDFITKFHFLTDVFIVLYVCWCYTVCFFLFLLVNRKKRINSLTTTKIYMFESNNHLISFLFLVVSRNVLNVLNKNDKKK